MKVYKNQNVFQAALDRIRWIFSEFPNPVVAVSGGKDSTVVFQLSMLVAEELGRLPLKVFFLDQEAEWQATVDMVKSIMYDERVEPYWVQAPLVLFNATSSTDQWLKCWDESKKDIWVHPQDPISIKENHTGEKRFAKLFDALMEYHFDGIKTCLIGGMRTEETPKRFLSLTNKAIYNGRTYGKRLSRRQEHYTFYPIYDWSFSDVWKSILDNEWEYNRLYDAQYRYGIQVRNMRVSNVHHETAVRQLFYMQEIEPETHNRLTKRLAGIDMATKFGEDDYGVVDELPFMFETWREYRDYLLEHLVLDDEYKKHFLKHFKYADEIFGEDLGDRKYKVAIQGILRNDWEGIMLENLRLNPKYIPIQKKNRALRDKAREEAKNGLQIT